MTDRPLFYRLLQCAGWAFLRATSALEAEGLEKIPTEGSLLVATNHLHALDAVVVGTVVPRRTAVFAASKFQGKLGGFVMEVVTTVIYVDRGEADRAALQSALRILMRGGTLAVAPEGTRSRSGGLQEGKHGVAYLASRTGAPIVPVAVWGQETAMNAWGRLRRGSIHVRVGDPICMPADALHLRSTELHAYTHQVMTALAGLLPAAYRGVYEDRVS